MVSLESVVLVRSGDLSSYVTAMLRENRGRLLELSSVNVSFEQDSYEKREGTLEILVGKTNRAQSSDAYASLSDKGYSVEYKDGAITVSGTNDAMLVYAMSMLFEKYIFDNVSGKYIALPESICEKSTEEDIAVIVDKGKLQYSLATRADCDFMPNDTANKGLDMEATLLLSLKDELALYTSDTVQNTTTSAADAQRREIIIGDTGREEIETARKNWAINQYGTAGVGNKLVVGGWSDTTLSLAVDGFKELLKLGTVTEGGAKTVYFMKDNLLGKCTKWKTDIPEYEGGKLSGANDADWGQLMWYITETTAEQYKAYCQKLEGEGFELKLSNSNVNNLYATYLKDTLKIHVYFAANDSTVRIISGDTRDTGLAADSAMQGSKIAEFSVTQIPLTYGGSGGMGDVITLEDGRFVIIDGGRAVDADTEVLYKILNKLNKRSDGIVIAGWFLTHEHSDHYGMFKVFVENYGKKVKIQNFYVSTPSRDFKHNSNNPTFFMEETFPSISASVGKIPVTVLHTGQKFKLAGVDFEVLFTTEDIYPSGIKVFNDASMVFRASTDKGSVIFLGDAYLQASEILCARYGSYLKSNVVQYSHHGWDGVTYEVYRYIAPDAVLWPNSKANSNSTTTSTAQPHYEINRKVVALVGASNIYVAETEVWRIVFPYTNAQEVKLS
jgi:beta-lactamase superfamily II metal-dependent hydrolase